MKMKFRVKIDSAGWLMVVGLFGETDLAARYAIDEILHRWGCQWYMPGELGACIPSAPSLALSDLDESGKPATVFRNVWYADETFKRRKCLYLPAGSPE